MAPARAWLLRAVLPFWCWGGLGDLQRRELLPAFGQVSPRDAGGELAWIENKNLNERRTVLVKPALADVRALADDKAPLVFQAEQNVVLDLNDLSGTGWARATHRDGQSGYIKVTAVWGL